MNFLVPLAWSALALALPIIAFYLIKTRPRKRVVSTSLFWRQLTPQVYNSSLWRKLRRWFSLLLQLLFLALLVFALAGPVTSWESLQPVSEILVLDPSASMQATDVAPSRWDDAVARARARIRSMRGTDSMALIVASDPPRVLQAWSSSRRTLDRALADAQVESTDASPAMGLRLATNLAAGHSHVKVTFLTDACWAADRVEIPDGIQMERIGGAPTNSGLTMFSARRSLAAPGDFQLAARVETTSTTPVEGRLEVMRDGRVMDVLPVPAQRGKAWEHTWNGQAPGAAQFTARISGFGAVDHLSLDDSAEAGLAARAVIRVKLFAPPNGFLDAALSAQDGMEWSRIWPMPASIPARANETENESQMLSIFYRGVPPADFRGNALIIDPEQSGWWGSVQGAIETPLVSEWKRDAAVLRHTGIGAIQLRKARAISAPKGAESFAESFGQPVIFGDWDARARRKWLALSFDLESTDLVLRTAFPILIGNIAESLRQTQTPPASALPGSCETALIADDKTLKQADDQAGTTPGMKQPNWFAHRPLWWWAAALGLAWLLSEWWSYTRRMTE